MQKKKRHCFEMEITSIRDVEDNPTRKDVEFIIHDFEMSSNYSFISKQVSENSLDTLNGMPIVAKYYEKSDYRESDDALGSHELEAERSRDDGEPILKMGTLPIGVFTEPARIETIEDDSGNPREVVVGKGILWASRYPNVVGLLKEWVDKDIPVVSSMEILYDKYKVDNGITEILNYYYEGHCLLNSETRGEHKKVYPAYDVSRLTKLVAEAAEQETEKEDSEMAEENKDIEVEPEVTEHEPKTPENQDEKVEGAQVQDDKTDGQNDLDPDTADKEDKGTAEQPEDTKDSEIEELKKELDSVKEENQKLEKQFSEATEKLVSLNSTIKELEPYKEKYEESVYASKLEEKKTFYSDKFAALDAKDKFENQEVQDLIAKSVYETQEGSDAKFQLNNILVDLVTIPEVKEAKPTMEREQSSKRESLIKVEDSFTARYFDN